MKKAIPIHKKKEVLPSIKPGGLVLHNIILLLLVINFFFSSCSLGSFPGKESKKIDRALSGKVQSNGIIHIILYFPDKTQSQLVPVDRIAEFDTSLEKTVINELLKGSPTNLPSPIPKGTRLLKVSRSGDMVTLNLSGEFKKNHPGGSTGELMSIYSIVNSLTEIPGVNSVLFKIENRLIDTLAGHMTFNKPITRNRAILNRNTTLNPTEVLKLQMSFESQGKWLDAYVLLSDDPKNPDRKHYNDYIVEMEEVRALGFTDQEYKVGEFALDKSGSSAKVRVDFPTPNSGVGESATNPLYFNTVKIDGVWMVDWSTSQG